jgi:hypothetical protein
MKNVQILIFLLVYGLVGFAQEEKVKTRDYPHIAYNYHQGTILPTNPFVKGDNKLGVPIDRYRGASFKVGWQNPGYTQWQRVYRGPYYGIGYWLGDFYSEELGNPMALYGYFGIPIFKTKYLQLYSDLQFGLAWHWRYYDSISNPYNIAIGGSMTVYLDLGFNAFVPLGKYLDLGAGFTFSHFSNGGFERPNRGLNIYSPSIELKYHLRGRPETRNLTKAEKEPKTHDLYIMLGYGDHQLNAHELSSYYYAVGGISAFYQLRHSNAWRSGLGVDMNYWWGLNALPDGSPGPRNLENLTLGFMYQPEFIIGDLSLVCGMGIYGRSYRYGNWKQFYQRLGVIYRVYDNFTMGVNIRAVNFMLAEFLEFNWGYRFKWKR